MKSLLLLLTLTGLCYGLQAPLQYKYKYYGTIFTGIPELSNQVAGWAMKADVEVFLQKNNGEAVFQLRNFRMAEYNGDLGCDVRGDVPEHLFQRAEDRSLNQAVEAPFKVNLFDQDQDYVIEYLEERFQWMTNVRKGIVSVFKNEILRGNIDQQIEETVSAALHEGRVLNVFSVKEDTLFGRCQVDYTVYPIPEQLAGIRNHEIYSQMEEDVQIPKEIEDLNETTKKIMSETKTRTGKLVHVAPQMEKDLWHVIRSVDFDQCNEIVALQTTPIGVQEPIHGSQFEWAKGRSSVTEFIFRGTPGQVRMERAYVEGVTTKMPFGLKTELLQARINQTLELVSVTVGNDIPRVEGNVQRTNTWMQEVYSPFETPKQSKVYPWVIYTGEGSKINDLQTFGMDYFVSKDISEIKTSIVEYVKTAAKLLTDQEQYEQKPEPGMIAEYLQKSSVLFKQLNKEEVLAIFNHFFEQQKETKDVLAQKLVVDAAAASGTYFAHSAIMEYIRQDKIPAVQIMTIFMTLTNNAESPLILSEIMDYVLSLNMKKEPFLTATVLINYAELLKNMCIHPQAREIHFSGPLYGDNGCNVNIKERFLPFLKNIIYSDSTTWEKDVAIQTLYSLGSVHALPILMPVVEGKITCSPSVRALAIYSLESWNFEQQAHIRNQVVDLLTDVYSDIGEDAEVREAALSTIVTWRPEASFWYRLAKTTWREPSKQFASFMTSVIESFAKIQHPFFVKQSQAALHAIKLAKPIVPSLKYSYLNIMTSRLVDRHIARFEGFAWLSGERAYNPQEFYYFLMTNLGGLDFTSLELLSITEGFFQKFSEVMQQKQLIGAFNGLPVKIAEDFYDKIQETIKAQTIHHHVTPKRDIFFRVFDHMNLFLPLNKETLSTLQLQDSEHIAELISKLGHGFDFILGKFFNPVDMRTVQPTELGLPLLMSTTSPIVVSGVTQGHLNVQGKTLNTESLNKMELLTKGMTMISSETQSRIQVLLPMTQHFVGTGIRSTRDITLPLNVVIQRNKKNVEGIHQQITRVEIDSHYKQKFSMVRASNVPYTSITQVLPLKTHHQQNVKVIANSEPKQKVMQLPNTYTGLNFDLTWKSEMAFPLTMLKFNKFISHPENLYVSPKLLYTMSIPTAKYWVADLEFDPQTSQTKKIAIELTVGTFGKTVKHPNQDLSGQDFFDQFEQDQTFNVNQRFHKLSKTTPINHDDTIEQRSQKMQNFFGGIAYSTSLKVDFQGDQQRDFEVVYSHSVPKVIGSRKQMKSQVAIIRSAIPQVDNEPTSVCLDVQKEYPAFSKLDKVEDILSMNLNKEIHADMTLDCQGTPVATLEGTYRLSSTGKQKLQQDIPQACDFDEFNPLHTFHSHAVYDEVKYTLTLEKVCNEQKHQLTTGLLSIVQEMLNNVLLKNTCSATEELNKIEVYANRSPVSGNWYINAQQEQVETVFEEIPHNNFFNYMYGIGEKTFEYHPDHVTTANLESETCAVTNQAVRTFDGFVYEFEPTNCWTVAAKDCQNEKGWMLLVRSPVRKSVVPDAKFVDVERGLVIEYSNNVVKVNDKVIQPVTENEVVRDNKGRIVLVVSKKNDYHMVQFAEDFYITAKNKIQIHIPKQMQRDMCGLCGNHDGETESEMVGPHRCFYDNAKMFAQAWTGPSESCDRYTLQQIRSDVEKYQKNCHTIESLNEKCRTLNKRCYQFGHMVEKLGDDKLCISSSPLPYCERGCEMQNIYDKVVEFNCWPMNKVPREIKNTFQQGLRFLTTPITYEPYFYNQMIQVVLPNTCKVY